MQISPHTCETNSGPASVLRSSDYAHPWLPDRGDGTFCNPIIHADYSDPDVIRVGDDFYLTASSFNCTPGLPILHSKDLVNWTIVNHAVENLPQPRYERVQQGCGIWAPALRFHAGKFWIFFPTPDEGIYVVTADDPAGKWSEPRLVQAGKGLIDPCPLWDDDGKAYLVHAYAGSRAGIKHRLRVCPMAPDGSKLLGEGRIVFYQPEKHPTIEGPKFYKRGGWYYILAPAGGVETGWQVALRSRNVYGPYEDRIVLAQGATGINGPHQGGLVDTAEGGWWFVHFQDAGVYGRIVHLQPVQWKGDWPLMGDAGQPVLHHSKPRVVSATRACGLQASDEFNGSRLGLQWQWNANHRDSWYCLGSRPGWLRLYPQLTRTSIGDQPNLLLQKFPARSFRIETLLEFSAMQAGEEAGLVVAGKSPITIGVQYDGTAHSIFCRAGRSRSLLAKVCRTVRLTLQVQSGGRCSLGFSKGDDFVSVPQKFQAQKGIWIGAKAGLYCLKKSEKTQSGYVDFDYFRFE